MHWTSVTLKFPYPPVVNYGKAKSTMFKYFPLKPPIPGFSQLGMLNYQIMNMLQTCSRKMHQNLPKFDGWKNHGRENDHFSKVLQSTFREPPGLINHSLIFSLGGYFPYSHFIWYLNGTNPIKQPKGLLIQGWHHQVDCYISINPSNPHCPLAKPHFTRNMLPSGKLT